MHVIVPMAGFGRRFQEAGYPRLSKPLIPVAGRPMLDWALECLPKDVEIHFVVRREMGFGPEGQGDLVHYLANSMHQKKGARTNYDYHLVDGATQGAALTVLAVAVGLPADAPVAVMNADQVIGDDVAEITERALSSQWDGYILTFAGTGPAWSYAVTNGSDRVVWVVEKKAVSPYATCGFYWWRRADLLVRSVCAMVASGQRTNNEFYLAPSFNFLPLADHDVRVVPVREFHGLGTPEQVQAFEIARAGGKTGA